jgi:opacity protein-like surface antigen
MKMNKILTSALALSMVSAVAVADESSVATSTTSSESILAKLEKSPLDLFLYTDHAIDTNTLESNEESDESKGNTIGAYSALYMGKLSYKFNSKTSAAFTGRFDTAKDLNTKDLEKTNTTTTWNRVILNVKQSILDEARNGVGLSVAVEKRVIPDTELRASADANGHTRSVINATKAFGKFSLNLTHFYAIMDRKDKTLENKTESYQDFYFVESFSLTDKLSLSTYQDYVLNTDTGVDPANNQTIELGLGAYYDLTSKVTIGVGVSSIAFKAHDNRATNTENWTRTPTYDMSLAISAF